jgi:hypothetical protein
VANDDEALVVDDVVENAVVVDAKLPVKLSPPRSSLFFLPRVVVGASLRLWAMASRTRTRSYACSSFSSATASGWYMTSYIYMQMYAQVPAPTFGSVGGMNALLSGRSGVLAFGHG